MITRRRLLSGGILVAIAGAGIVVALTRDKLSGLISGNAAGSATAEPGATLYLESCASCHGKNLEGQPDWRSPLASGLLPAPPHDASGHSWHHPDRVLIGITTLGLKPYAGADYESAMPAFGETLTPDQILAIVEFIKSTWPEKQRTYQQAMTLQDQAGLASD